MCISSETLGCQRQNRGPSFFRDQLLGKVVVVDKSVMNLTDYTGKCVTPVVVRNWRDGAVVGSVERPQPNTAGNEDPEFRDSFNFYHGEATMETDLPEDAVHRSLMARVSQFGLDPFDLVQHVSQRNLKILAAMKI